MTGASVTSGLLRRVCNSLSPGAPKRINDAAADQRPRNHRHGADLLNQLQRSLERPNNAPTRRSRSDLLILHARSRLT